MKNSVTLVETINNLKQQGYIRDFNVGKNRMVCNQTNAEFAPEDFKIDKVFRFEGETNPDDQAVLYAISSSKFNMKGVLVNGYGISSDSETDAIINKLQIHPE